MLANLNGLDIALLVVCLLSAAFGVLRGLVREILSLVAWLAAAWLALRFSPPVAVYMDTLFASEGLRRIAAFLLVFIASLVGIALVNRLLAVLIRMSHLGLMDRLLGFLFGALRGVMIGVVFIMLTDMTPLSDDPAWDGSSVAGYYRQLGDWLADKIQTGVPSERWLPSWQDGGGG